MSCYPHKTAASRIQTAKLRLRANGKTISQGSDRTTPRDSPMTKTQVEVITSVERRRRWSRAEKERIVAAALEPGAVASEVARAAGIHTSQLFRWRRQLCERVPVPASFNPVTISPEPERHLRDRQRAPARSRSSLPMAGGCG